MTKRFRLGLTLLLVVPGLFLATSCAKKAIHSDAGMTQTTGAQTQTSGTEGTDAQTALENQRLQEERLRQEAKEMREQAERTAFENEHIYFEYDKSRITAEAKSVLKKKARWLLANPGTSIVVEGHCDERGTNEYNMALGDRRAQSAKRYLMDLGVTSGRITTISYGEEKPLDLGGNEAAWTVNRRAQFVLQ
jgi:peptidoglycan-associated lipoprotein